MLVTNLEWGRKVIDRLFAHEDVSADTETQAKEGFGRKDLVVYNRTSVKIWSACHRGEAYSFPTNHLDPNYPTMSEWIELLKPYAASTRVTKVGHNLKYDIQVLYCAGIKIWKNVYCTMIGAWAANAAISKGLKERAPLYGRYLKSQSYGKKAKLFEGEDLTQYAEGDVIQTDELFQMQTIGYVMRPKYIKYLEECGTELVVENPMPSGKIKIEREEVTPFMRLWIKYHELPIMKSTMRAERRGFPIDRKILKTLRVKCIADKERLEKKLYRAAGKKLNLDSPKQIVELFDAHGIESPVKTKKGAPSVGKNALFFMQGHELVDTLQQFRKVNKLYGTYISAEGLERYIAKDGAIHCSLNTLGAVTGRFSASNPNLTNIPAAADIYAIKLSFVPPKGMSLICLDFSQLELRVMGILSEDPAMRRILSNPKADIHQHTADEFGVGREPTAKQINFLLQYGGTEYALSMKLTLEGVPTTTSQAAAYRQRYAEVYARIPEYREELLEQHRNDGFVTLLTGRPRWLLDINWDSRSSVHKAETTLSNNVVQGSGQDLLKASIIRSDPACISPDEELPKRIGMPKLHRARLSDYARKLRLNYRPAFKRMNLKWILQIHDEVIYFCNEKDAPDCARMLAEIMCWHHFFPPIKKYCLPIVVDGGWGTSWRAAKGKDKSNPPDGKVEVGFKEFDP